MHFVVATDGSRHSEAALEHAIDLVTATDGSLTVISVVQPSVTGTGGEDPIVSATEAEGRLLMEAPDDAEDRYLSVLETAAEIAAERGIDAETELLEGDPKEAISDYLETSTADGVVVGHRGLSEQREDLLGSVAKSLMQRSPVPVTVVSS